MDGVRANCTLEVPFTHQVDYLIGTTSTLVGIFAHFQAVVSMGSILLSFGASFAMSSLAITPPANPRLTMANTRI